LFIFIQTRFGAMTLRLKILSVFIFIIYFSCSSQKYADSRIYNTEGKLIANDSFQISRKLLKKFIIVENEFIDTLLNQIKYPDVFKDNGILLDLILDFTVNQHGQLNDLKITNIHATYAKFDEKKFVKEYIPVYSNYLKESIRKIQCSNEFNGKNERYYIPVKFYIGSKPQKSIEKGWLYIVDKPKELKPSIVY
jgi:hypothetical protein